MSGETGGTVMLWEAFCWHGLGPTVPLDCQVIVNQYKVTSGPHIVC